MLVVICLNVSCGNAPRPPPIYSAITEFVGIRDTETVIIARPGILIRLQIYILIGNTRFASH